MLLTELGAKMAAHMSNLLQGAIRVPGDQMEHPAWKPAVLPGLPSLSPQGM